MTIERLIAEAFAPVLPNPVIRRSTHADYQIDSVLTHARTLKRDPREVAAEVLRRVELPFATAHVAGPGFLNITLSKEILQSFSWVPGKPPPRLVTIDYSAPNVAKEMHVGHLRSTVIGDAAARLLAWLGHDVHRMNHVGDWGTPFGMLIEHLLDIGETEAAHELSVGDLNAFYRAARVKFDADPSFKQRARARVVALQGGDETTRRLWQVLVAESEKYFLAVYDRLGVTLTAADFRGESSYNDSLVPVLNVLTAQGLIADSDGARCAFVPGYASPLIVRKSDGGFGYAATDLASIRYRARDLRADRMLYIVGSPQRQHFEQVFAVARRAGWLRAEPEFIGFGSVLGEDGKMLRSRAGEAVKLSDLLDEAVARALMLVRQKNPSLDTRIQGEVARAVGIGAVKYADLSTGRNKDYVFAWDRMLATEGDTAAYLQYTCARIHSIFRRSSLAASGTIPVDHPAERALALELLGFAPVVEAVASSLEFQKLTGYLYRLAGTFTAFYERCPVLASPDPLRGERLALCARTRDVLTLGLNLLGIESPERM
jgi:arginyl-tRNA synthetase